MQHRALRVQPIQLLAVSLMVALLSGACASRRATPPTEGVLDAGDHTIQLRHDSRDRSYIVHVPPNIDSPAAVVIALHGGGGNGADFQDQNGLDQIADREGFLTAYPEGTGVLRNRLHTWNSGDSCCGYSLDNNIDDVDFLREVIADLTERVNLNTDRVYITGHSNGAMMAYRFAVEAPELVTAIVPVGGAIDLEVPALLPAIAMLHIHSLDDPRALYGGGEGPPFPGTDRGINHEPVLPGIEAWAAAVGCESSAQLAGTLVGTGDDASHTADRLTWTGCNDGVVVEHLRLSGTGHGWPGVTVGPIIQNLLGPPTSLISASEEVWAFASQFER